MSVMAWSARPAVMSEGACSRPTLANAPGLWSTLLTLRCSETRLLQSPAHVLLNESQVCRHLGCSWGLGLWNFSIGVGALAFLVESEISLLVSSVVRTQFPYAAACPVLTLPSWSCFFSSLFLFFFRTYFLMKLIKSK